MRGTKTKGHKSGHEQKLSLDGVLYIALDAFATCHANSHSSPHQQ
jgi:hypothetical protein